jgi:hypothetical protein
MLQRKTPLRSKTPLKSGAPMKSGGQLKSRAPMKRTAMKKTPAPKQTEIQKSARGQDCTVRVPGVCNFNPETTVLGHLNGGGMAAKHHDVFAAYVCSDCHAWLDGGYVKTATRAERDLLHLQGVIKTQPILMELGLIIVPEAA